MIDGLSVCLPDDSSLMFSILECLPKAHRCTVLFLMDHLKAIVNNSDVNKMNSNSIATIFGPLFTCTDNFDSFNLRKTIEVFKFLIDIWPSKKEASILDPVKMNNSLNNQLNSSMSASVNSPSKSYLKNLNNELNLNKSNLISDHRRRLSSDSSLEKDDLLSKSLVDSNALKKTNHQFSSNLNQQQQTSQSSTNLNSLSSYQKPFSYHLPNNRDFNNFTSSSNLNSSLLNKPNSLRNSTSAIDSSVGLGTNLGHSSNLNQLSTNTGGYFGPMDSGLGSTTSGTGSGTNSGGSSSGRNTSSSTSTVTAKKSVGWASSNLNSQDNQSPTSRLNTSLIGNTSNSALIGNSLSSSTNKYSSDYLNDKYSNDSPTRYNYSSILDNNKTSRSNVLIGAGSLIGDTSSKYSDLSKKYDSYG